MQKGLAVARARRLAARADIMKAIADVYRVVGRYPELENHLQLLYNDGSGSIFKTE